PARADRDPQGRGLELQVPVPGECHEDVRQDEKCNRRNVGNGNLRNGKGGHERTGYGWSAPSCAIPAPGARAFAGPQPPGRKMRLSRVAADRPAASAPTGTA